jgi:hypothetical protein
MIFIDEKSSEEIKNRIKKENKTKRSTTKDTARTQRERE